MTSSLPGQVPSPKRPRAAIVVTGSELVRGERTDLNGPFLAAQALELGLEPARITIVGDRPDELEAAFTEGMAADLLVQRLVEHEVPPCRFRDQLDSAVVVRRAETA